MMRVAEGGSLENRETTIWERFLVLIVVACVLGILALVFGLPLMTSMQTEQYFSQQTEHPFSQRTQDGFPQPLVTSEMGVIEMAASQTALAEYVSPAPSATLRPGLAYWYPASAGTTTLRFEYASKDWARTDVDTLASLQIAGCTLRRAGGHGLGPGWSTEETSLDAGNITFLVIVSKYKDVSQFVTYSGPDEIVFEIAGPVPLDGCRQAGESILKSVSVYTIIS